MAVFGNDTLWKRATQPEQTYKALGKERRRIHQLGFQSQIH